MNANVLYCYPNDYTIAWAGSYNGKVYRCTDFTNTATHWTPSASLGGGMVTGVTADPNNPSNVYAVVAGVGGNNKHFYASNDTGKTWTSPATNFPNISCNSITISPSNNFLFVGTDGGVVYSADAGKTWTALSQNMPFVQVNSLKVRGNNNQYLLAGTYGRGMYYMDISSLTGSVSKSTPSTSSIASLDQSFPNPISLNNGGNAVVGFTLKNPTVAKMTLHDLLGREIKVLANAAYSPGHHTVDFNTSELATGTYICALTTAGITLTEKISVMK